MENLHHHNRAIKLLELLHEANRMVLHHAGIYNDANNQDFNNMLGHHKKRHGVNVALGKRLAKAYNERINLIKKIKL